MSEQSKYYELDQDVVEHFMKIFNSKSPVLFTLTTQLIGNGLRSI